MLCTAGVATGAPALAGNCPSTPRRYDLASCGSVCAYDSAGTKWVCDVSACSASTVTMVGGYGGSSYYQAWGTCGVTEFCCETDGSHDPTAFAIVGSGYNDDLGFTWGSGTYNLTPMGASAITAVISGMAGNDTLRGSHEVTDYLEALYGLEHDDTLQGNAGDDVLDGGSGCDFLNGGIGDDVLRGGSGDDTLLGGAGADDLDGDGDMDVLAGGAGNDDLDGGDGGDTLCGDDGGDSLDDGDGGDEGPSLRDVLWGATGIDTDTCHSASTSWDGVATEGGDCGPTIGTRPEACP